MVAKPARWWRGSERGAGATDYLVVLLLIAVLAGAIAVSPAAGGVRSGIEKAICRVGQAGGLQKECEPAGDKPPPLVAVDPDMPTANCLTDIDYEYLENTTSARLKRVDILTDGGGQITLRRYVQGNGKPDLWQVWDMGWSDAGVGTPGENKFKAGIWAAIAGSNTEIYNFTDEKQARDFYEQLKDYRLGNWFKLAVRTNPISGAVVRLGSWMFGDGVDEFWGGKEPDRKPSQEVYDGGLWFGGFNDVALGKLPFSIVGKDWGTASGGVWKDNDTGETTYYLQGSDQLMESLEIDIERALKALGLDKKTTANLNKAMDWMEQQLSKQLGTPIKFPDGLRRGLATDSGVGVGLRGTISRWYGLTVDKNGKPVSFVQLDDVQGSWHLRGDISVGPLGFWYQNSMDGVRWRTTKTLDLTDPKQMGALSLVLRQAGQGAGGTIVAPFLLDELFDKGLGTMGKVDYDYEVTTANPNLNAGIGAMSFEWEGGSSKATSAQYFKPDVGWVPWEKCGL
ncbi:hypothetical protein [Actinomadura sp. HBU206391]|uniref:hypothetical protein n=1 Tax=Actinomadura sp. HBU206391 TaxID=2731692 RepID=UPI00164F31A6|nr:hypothetical protein [Actinomadura sp. HBU206391]MBC6457756.1 hypothetical protein [Actinomadura sp. HBU206391]